MTIKGGIHIALLIQISSGDPVKAVSLYRHPPGELQHIFSVNLTHPFPSADFIFYVLVFLTEGSI